MERILILFVAFIISHIPIRAEETERVLDNFNGIEEVNARHCHSHSKHRGPQGKRGPRGLAGPIGITGPQGSPGSIGLNGTKGINGQTCNANFASLKLFGGATSFDAGTNINFHATNSANYLGGSVTLNFNTGEIMVSDAGNYLISYGFSGNTPLQIAEIRINGISIGNSSISSTISGQMTTQTIIAPITLINGIGTISLHAVTPISLYSNLSVSNPTIAFFEIIELD